MITNHCHNNSSVDLLKSYFSVKVGINLLRIPKEVSDCNKTSWEGFTHDRCRLLQKWFAYVASHLEEDVVDKCGSKKSHMLNRIKAKIQKSYKSIILFVTSPIESTPFGSISPKANVWEQNSRNHRLNGENRQYWLLSHNLASNNK